MILYARFCLDARADIHTVGAYLTNRFGDILGVKAAGEN
jgi:hypothetical protein